MARVWEVSRARRWQLVFKLPIAYFFLVLILSCPISHNGLRTRSGVKQKKKLNSTLCPLQVRLTGRFLTVCRHLPHSQNNKSSFFLQSNYGAKAPTGSMEADIYKATYMPFGSLAIGKQKDFLYFFCFVSKHMGASRPVFLDTTKSR